MISFRDVTVTYAGAHRPALVVPSLDIDESELALVVGRTGSGKSTLLRAVNGTVPHFTGGTLTGTVRVDGRDTRTHRPRDLAGLVGVVGQDPLAGFVTDTVEEELAYGMEQLGLDGAVMRKRVEETLDLLGIADLRDAALTELSGGQQQRVAIGSVLTAHPRVLILDEPTSALDPTGGEDVLATLSRLVHDLGLTVVVAEHRIERVIHAADTIIHVAPDGHVSSGDPAELMRTSDVAPPVVELGRFAGWSPLPLSLRDARRAAGPLRAALGAVPGPSRPTTSSRGPARVHIRSVDVTYGDLVAVDHLSLDLNDGEVVALMGRNGSGKSSLLWAIQGTGHRAGGAVSVDGTDPATLAPRQRRGLVGLVPQTASDLLYLDTVEAECTQADRDADAGPGTCAALLDRLAPGIRRGGHPRDLSEGQRLALVLAIQLTADPPVLLLDEPTRGLDYTAKAALRDTLRALAGRGRVVVTSTHDVEFVAAVADRVVVLADGEVVADGPVHDVLLASPAFAPQVAKVLAPQPVLTLEELRARMPEGTS